jgi:hypothetical protein
MKIAIVTGGFEGVRKQFSIWRLEQEVEVAERTLLKRAEQTEVCRTKLRNLQNQLAAAGPSQERKEK